MGDSCSFEMTILKRDKALVNHVMFGKDDFEEYNWCEEEDNKDGTMVFVEYEASYGYHKERENLAEHGIVFEGHHGHGGGYGACVFACFGGKHVEINSIEGSPAALVNINGDVDETSLKDAREYCRILDSVKKYFKEIEE